MRRLYIGIFFLVVTPFVFAGQPIQPTQPIQPVAAPLKTIDTVLKEFGQDINIGILVKDARTGQILYSKNSDRLFMPASNQKLFTAYTALAYLGPNFTYQTSIFADPTKIQTGILNDNVYLQFSGDPTFTFDQLERLIAALSKLGLNRINGKFIIDDSLFDQTPMSLGTSWDDKDYCWGAPISTGIIDGNCAGVIIAPAPQAGHAATLSFPNYPQTIRYINNVTTATPNETCTLSLNHTNPTTYVINGCVKVGDAPRQVKMAIENPRANLQHILKYLLQKYQMTVAQGFEFKKLDVAPRLLATESSKPLSVLVKTMLKESDNMIANALFKTVGAAYTHSIGSFESGNAAVRDFLLKVMRLDIAKTTLLDGAGGSRYNFLSPQQIVTLLQANAVSPSGSFFTQGLPVSGMDGTLKNRMNHPSTLGRVFAKTGTETAVSALSGYLQTRSNRTLIFSIMINGFVDMPTRYEALEDEICKSLAETM